MPPGTIGAGAGAPDFVQRIPDSAEDRASQRPETRGRAALTRALRSADRWAYFFFAVFFLAPALAAAFFAMRRLLEWQAYGSFVLS